MKAAKTPYRQPWIGNSRFDLTWILGPSFISIAILLLLPDKIRSGSAMPLAAWVTLIVFIDVAHVYSTLLRTYLDPVRFERHRTLFLVAPVACYAVGVLLYSIDDMLFWRVLAYLAVFHFIRQQYGLMRLYSREEKFSSIYKWIDKIIIYAATIYPVLWWHLHPDRNFNWFTEGDFIFLEAGWLLPVLDIIYVLILTAYIIKEISLIRQTRSLNIPRNTIILGTILSWYAGIVLFNGDLAFTLLNVVSHGIPYMALVWLMAKKEKNSREAPGIRNMFFRQYGVVLFLGLLFFLAWFEEGLWDALVWREHSEAFTLFMGLPRLDDKALLSLVVPLLSLPQSSHYVLDGFIWKKGS
ncbi:MAG: hypothetical protein EOP49_02010 [Sphingobacteriales bacterium]|nr:MAG: hypothetical protein EOP49_02010 [Sphingobacteriales bacterium]